MAWPWGWTINIILDRSVHGWIQIVWMATVGGVVNRWLGLWAIDCLMG